MHSEYKKTWNFYNDEEVRNKVIAEYGDLMKIPDDKAKEILDRYNAKYFVSESKTLA
jgi:hypothetical protein